MELYIAIAIAVIVIIALIFTNNYALKKTRTLRQKGREYCLYFLGQIDILDYYRNKDRWISTKYGKDYEELKVKENKWYVRFCRDTKIRMYIEFYELANETTVKFAPYFDLNHYFASSEFRRLNPLGDKMLKTAANFVNDKETHRYFYEEKTPEEHIRLLRGREWKQNFLSKKIRHNKEFVEKELRDNKEFFDTVLRYPLDNQQRESIVKLEDNCLVISSAGSGKTSTSIAKVKYLLEKRHIPKEEILVLSYNHKTAAEFQERLDVPGLTCKTFHALAQLIIGQAEGARPDVCDSDFLLKCYYALVRKSEDYKNAITKFFGELASVTKNEHEYNESEPYYKDRATYGILAPYGDMNGSPVYTRSEEEKKICTWLSTHGVDFLYEQPYPIDTADERHRQYKPDFTIYYTSNGRRYYLFLEHFGVDQEGNVPQWFGEGHQGGFAGANRDYNEGIRWKRQIHHENETLLLETRSSMFQDGTIYSQLEAQLRRAGVPIRELSAEEKYQLLFQRNEAMENNVMTLFKSFISLLKSNGKTFDLVMKAIEEDDQEEDFIERCRYLMYEVIKPLYDEYESSLKEKGQMDFTDTILHAAELCEKKQWQTPYSYILVDEFQDISVDRYKFLKSLRKEEPLTKMYCVGDDWQSIYRFSGSDMNLFNDYPKYFGATEKCKIETTYRFGNPLVEHSSAFILKNPNQVEKVVRPCSANVATNLSFVEFTRGERDLEYLAKIKELIDSIPQEESIMLLGRYNYEVKVFPRYCIEEIPDSKRSVVRYAGRTMNFMSVHASKGLEADHVIILNCSQDKGGFPSRVSDDPILGYVLSEIDTFEYSEERRLFYVAITRAKKHTYVMYNEYMPSVFVTEMQEKDNDAQLLCPVCKQGRLRILKDAVARNGNRYRNYSCTNSIAGCRFFWRVYFETEEELNATYHHQMDRFFTQNEPTPAQPPSHNVNLRNIPIFMLEQLEAGERERNRNF